MAVCANCGTSNIDGTKFCVTCGAQLGEAPAPESWRASSELGTPPAATDTSSTGSSSAGGYTPQTPPPTAPSNYPTYTPPQGAQGYQPQGAGSAQPVHPAIPAIISLFLPGIGLLMVPNKQKLAFTIFGGYIGLNVVLILLTIVTLGIGACIYPLIVIANVAAAVHSWDEAAKSSGGQFQPILFK